MSEIQARLVKNGASNLSFDYKEDRELKSLSFRMDFDGIVGPVYFSLTPDIVGVLEAMQQSGAPRSLLNMAQACRVAWRIEKDWLEAQLAKIESKLATPLQLFLPYAVMADGVTFYQKIAEGNNNHVKLLCG